MLEVGNISVSYGHHRALEGASVRVGKGEVCVILGGNGAGKSTLLNAIAGMVHAEPGGEVTMDGETITGSKPHRIVEKGIALVPEGRGIFGELTVAENLQLGAFAARARAGEAETLERIYAVFPRLAERKDQIARTMSGGEQQMVAIGRALMSKPDILMLDEPSLGLSPLLVQELFGALAGIARTGVGILLVEQNAKQSLKIADRGYLIENGRVTGENTAGALMDDPAVAAAYLGGTGKAQATARPRIALPPSIRLPLGTGVAGYAVTGLADRAGAIRQAFVRALRRDDPIPSAFVGRYNPKIAPDPWHEIAAHALEPALPAHREPSVSHEARKLGQQAASFASQASARLAAHTAITRLSSPRPSAFARQIPAPGPASAPARASIADMVERAAAVHSTHVSAQRRSLKAFAIPAGHEAAGRKKIKSAKDKRKKHKEA